MVNLLENSVIRIAGCCMRAIDSPPLARGSVAMGRSLDFILSIVRDWRDLRRRDCYGLICILRRSLGQLYRELTIEHVLCGCVKCQTSIFFAG